MRRVLASLLLGTFIFTLVSPIATAATPKAGAACNKLGQTATSANIKFTCVKSGTKLIWNKGVALNKQVAPTPTPSPTPIASPTPTPTPSPTPTPTVKPFKAVIPIPLPVVQNGPLTFANIQDHISEIPKVAFDKVQNVIAANSITSQISNDVHIGPNTQLDITGGTARIQEILLQSQKLWSGFTQVSNFRLFLYNAKDEPWAEQEWVKVANSVGYFENETKGEIQRIAGNCQETVSPGVFKGTPSKCRGADSTAIANTNDAILTIGQGTSEALNDPYATSGGIIGHEYAHSVQAAQWIGKPSSYCTLQTQTEKCNRSWNSNWGFSPCWIFEGLPNSIGVMGIYSSFDNFQSYRKNLPFSQGPTKVTDYTEVSLLNYLVNQSHSTCYSDGNLYRLGYAVGALAVEALTAIGGPQAVMALYSLGAEDTDFETAFQKVYGISWADGSKVLAKVLALEYATYGPPPQ